MMNEAKSNWDKFTEDCKSRKMTEKIALFLRYLDTEQKEREIRTGGSIPGNKQVMNRAGQAYLYRRNGLVLFLSLP